jgi:dihydroorotase
VKPFWNVENLPPVGRAAGLPNGALVIRGGRVVDPAHGRDGVMDILVENGRVARVGPSLAVPAGARVLEAGGCVVIPGVVDMHVHLREPGGEGAETIETGTRSAAVGGVTSVVAMPNTQPPADDPSGVRFVLRRAAETAWVRVFPAGAITIDRAGEKLAEIGGMVQAGAVAVTDDGAGVADSRLLRLALDYARMFDVPVIEHAEDKALMADGVMNEGALATRLGHRGIPPQTESIAVARDIALAELTGARLHVTHISTQATVELVRRAKAGGVKVTADATPHHFSLTEEAVALHGANAKMNPPLRTEADRRAILDGIKDGTVDAVATDHAPHSRAAKEQEFSLAPFGVVGLETLLPLVVTHLVIPGLLTWPEAVRRLSLSPARILNLPLGHLGDGAPADITIIDPAEERVIESFASKSANSPFLGQRLKGFARATIVAGRVVYPKGEL